MKILCLTLIVAVFAVGQVPLAPVVGPNEVLAFLGTMALPEELRAALTPAMQMGMESGRLTPGVAYTALQSLASLSPAQATEALSLVLAALTGGFSGDPLLNEMLKGIRLSRPWKEIMTMVQFRLDLLRATRQVLTLRGVVSLTRLEKGIAMVPSTKDQLALETEMAWAIGDFILSGRNPADGFEMESFVRQRLFYLRGVISPQVVDQLLAVLSPALVQEIINLALQPERR